MSRVVVVAGCVLVALVAAAAAAVAPVTLPNGWRLAPPPPTTVAVGTLPTGIAASRDGSRIFVLETGHRKPALRVLDARTLATLHDIELIDAYGAPLRDPQDDGVWIGATSYFQEQIAHIDTERGAVDRTVSLPIPFAPSAMAFSPDGRTLAVAGDLANRVAFVDVATGTVAAFVPTGRHPAALAYSPDGKRLYVADRAESQLDVIDPVAHAAVGRVEVGLHPAALAVAGGVLYVADTDDDDVAVVSLASGSVVQRAELPFVQHGVVGASPDALYVEGDRLYVPCGAANAIAVFRRSGETLSALGAMPTGWYPTAIVSVTGGALVVADGKGERGHANPEFTPQGHTGYVADNLVGSIRRIERPSDRDLQDGIALVESLGAPYARRPQPDSAVVRAHGPIAHVIYVVKENRTYDQVLGDLSTGDGDPKLVMFGERVTPNQHAIASRFGIFDRFFTNSHVSADGHNWSMAAFANDYLERTWPANYAGRRPFYDYEDGAEASIPHSGYLWDAAGRARVSYRNYGEFVTSGPTASGVPTSTTHAGLQTHTDFQFATFDMSLRDADRFTEWKREFDAFEKAGTLPQLEIVRFPRDHTAGTQVGKNTPEAMVADNDRAVGLLVDAVSHSPDWKSTAIFVLEDDAQNGADHVDEQRSTFYLASPYAKGGLIHGRYTTASVLRTIETILGMTPLSAYDAGAVPLADAFTATPDLRPFDALPARVDLDAKNGRSAYRAHDSDRLDFAEADKVDDGTLNDILWGAVKGPRTPRPVVGWFEQ